MDLLNSFLELPKILNREFSPTEAFNYIKDEFKTKLNFDFVLIGYFDAKGIEVKTMSDVDERVYFTSKGIIGKDFNNFISENKGVALKIKPNKHCIINEIGISVKKNCSAVLLPLSIREAVFGVILGIKFQNELISEEKLAVSQAFASICSYIVKDAELSNVFKLQLKILNDNVIEKTTTIDDMKEQNTKIKEAEQLKTEFLMNMSHSLRTPLNAIIGSSEALQMKVFGELNKKQEEYILDIQNSGKEMLGLVNDILDMSKINAGAMRLVKDKNNICLLIKEAVSIIKSLADKKNIKINCKLPQKAIYIMLDAQKINQVLYNLLSNAVKFTKENGNIEIGVVNKTDTIEVYVKDDGIGIDKKYHGKIFGKFEQIENSYSKKYASTGLGLTITKELIELHSGSIRVESIVNSGTTFIFELPKK